MPATNPLIVAEVVLPVVVILPGVLVSVQFPDGKPFSTTAPVEAAQVVWVIVPRVGAAGVTGCELITTLPHDIEVQPAAFVTVNV